MPDGSLPVVPRIVGLLVGILRTIVPVPLVDTEMSKVVPLLGATCVIDPMTIPGAVEPEVDNDPVVNVETSIASENTAVNTTGLLEVGSACPDFWLIVTVEATCEALQLIVDPPLLPPQLHV